LHYILNIAAEVKINQNPALLAASQPHVQWMLSLAILA
jgi:hypothetical protein